MVNGTASPAHGAITAVASASSAPLATASKSQEKIEVGAGVSAPISVPSAAPRTEVPAGCFRVSYSTTTSWIEVCNPEQDPAWFKYANVSTSVVALVVSAVAAYVAWNTLRFMRTQNLEARSASVRDEYWLRTVVSPTSIEPFQEFVTLLRADLPTAKATQLQVKDFWVQTTRQFNEFSGKFQSLALVSTQLNDEVQIALQRIEDAVSRYTGGLSAHLANSNLAAPDRQNAVQELTVGMVALFRLIQQQQEASFK